MPKSRLTLLALTLGATLTLAACESTEERAEAFYQSALELMEAGQEEQAILEFRNVFKYNGTHKEARRTYADLLMQRGEVSQAMGQYLRLVEQYPNETEVRWLLAENSLTRGNWDEVRRHGQAALELDPEAVRSQVLGVAIDYQQIKSTRPHEELAPVMARAETLLADHGFNTILMRLKVDHALAGTDPQSALPVIDAVLAETPESRDMHELRFRLLAEAGDTAGTGAQLQKMAELYPEDVQIRSALVRWYMLQRDFDGAETYLRTLAGPLTGKVEDHVALVQLVQATRGGDAAKAELAKLVAANEGTENAVLYSALSATIDFENGDQEAAVTQMRSMLQDAPEGARRNEAQAVMARMLDATGAQDEARALVDTILEADPGLSAALKLRAAWLIEEDKPGQAVVVLRRALDQRPNDAETLTLMAAAHEREGNTELAIERLALAVEASNNAPEETLRYVRALANQGRTNAAMPALEDALRRSPADLGLLTAMAELHIADARWGAAQEVIDRLRGLGTPVAIAAAQQLQAGTLLGQNRIEESLSFLQEGVEAAETDDAAVRAVVLVVQTQIRAGRLDEARASLDDALTAHPENANLRLLSATLSALQGDMAAAEAGYRALVAEFPTVEPPVRLLIGLLAANGRPDAARDTLATALTHMPNSGALLMLQADFLQQDKDVEGALAVYEKLYENDSNSVVLANNLASLLATHRTDEESLERAFAISRRLRGVEVPAVQDTYGWIAYLRGNYEEARPYLEAAAKGLPEDPVVQMHLGLTYAKLVQDAAARTYLTRALELAGENAGPEFNPAREALAALPEPGQ